VRYRVIPRHRREACAGLSADERNPPHPQHAYTTPGLQGPRSAALPDMRRDMVQQIIGAWSRETGAVPIE